MYRVKVISGFLKGRNIKGFNLDGTRPTMDRVKEYGLDLDSAYCISEKDFNKVNERSAVNINDIFTFFFNLIYILLNMLITVVLQGASILQEAVQ